MSGHKPDYRDRGQNHGRGAFSGPGLTGATPVAGSAPGIIKPISWIVVIVGLAVWSFLAWIGYISVDGLLDWAAANAGGAIDSGKNVASAVGIGKEAAGVVDALNVNGLLSGSIGLLQAIAKPAIVIIWALGALLLLAIPFILSKIGGLLSPRRY